MFFGAGHMFRYLMVLTNSNFLGWLIKELARACYIMMSVLFKPSQTYTFNITIKSNIGVASNTELDLGFLESGAGVSFLSISS